MKLKDLISIAGLSLLSGNENRELDGCYIGDLLSLAMSKVEKNNVWITIQSNINIVAVASLTEAGCIIICEGFDPDEGVILRAKNEDIAIAKSPLSAFELSKILIQNGF